MPQGQKDFTIFLDFAKIKNTVVFEKIIGRLTKMHSFRGVLLSRSSEFLVKIF